MTSRFLLPAALAAALSISACGGGTEPDPNEGNATLSGTVRAATGSAALQGATVSVGAAQATTDASGHFELTGLPAGAATVQAERPGYEAATAQVTMAAGPNTHDFSLADREIYEPGTTAAYVPAGVGPMRGAIIVLGGPVTSGFVTGGQLVADNPELETSLQALGASLRALAKSARLMLLGSETVNIPNTAATDDELFAVLATVAQESGHPEIADAPVLMFGLSAGSREAGGLVLRHPGRTIGLLLRVPVAAPDLIAPEALAVPAFLMQAELDAAPTNAAIQAIFATNRSRGARWALAVEPGVGHSTATSVGNQAVTRWISAALARIPAAAGAPLTEFAEPSGWLGDPATLEIAPWADYPGDRASASWHLSESAAQTWKTLGTGGGG